MTIELSVLLPTRGRTEMLKTSLLSLANLANNPQTIEMLLAFDNDDQDSYKYCQENILPELDRCGITYKCLGFERLGYIRLNEYINALAKAAQGRWLMFWGDDAIMETQGWDDRITEVNEFRVLRIPTHNSHPYAIFPIVPKEWYTLFGYFSAHQLSDSWVSQIGYLVDIVRNIDVGVVHDRFDITGNNRDETWENRPMLEGNPDNPLDFNHVDWRLRRIADAGKIASFLKSKNEETSWFDAVMANKQNPWEKMTGPIYDPNKQLTVFKR